MKSLGEAVSLSAQFRTGGSGQGSGVTGGHLTKEAVTELVQKVEGYRSSLEQLDHHVGMLHLRECKKQGAKVSSWWLGGGEKGLSVTVMKRTGL